MTADDPPVALELIDPPDRAAVGESVAVGLIVRRSAEWAGPSVLRLMGTRSDAADLNSDLFERDVLVGPGEEYRCTVRLTFNRPGPADLAAIYLQAEEPASQRPGQLVPLPGRPLRVVPSFNREVAISVSRICGYELGNGPDSEMGTKVEIEFVHRGSTPFADMTVAVGPRDAVRAGVCERRRPTFDPADVFRFDAVLVGPTLELDVDATAAGDSVGPIRRTFSIPTEGSHGGPIPYRFLEPRQLTNDRVVVTDKVREREVRSAGGEFAVYGGEVEYQVVIHPTQAQATRVVLYAEVGRVGVTEPRRLRDGGWEFPVTVVASPYVTTPVRLYYDVVLPDRTLRGELYLSVRPTAMRHLLFAATLGIAVTLKGVAAIGSVILNRQGVLDNLPELFDRLDSLNLAFALCIPIIFAFLRAGDWAYRRFLDE